MAKLPKSWSDITLRQFVDIHDVIQQPADPSNPLDRIERECQIYSILSGENYNELLEIPMKDLVEKLKAIGFTNDLPKEKQIPYFKLGGYRWIVLSDIKELSAGQFMDVTHLTKVKENIMGNLSQLMAIFCKPQKWSWEKLKWVNVKLSHNKKTELLWDSPVTIAYPLALFFCDHLTELLINIVNSSNQTLQTLNTEIQNELASQNTGAGT